MEYADGTSLVQGEGFLGGFVKGKAICADNVVRAVRFPGLGLADTFFSVPASVQVKGKTVSGFITVETREGYSTPTDDDPLVVKFIHYRGRKNGGMLPDRDLP